MKYSFGWEDDECAQLRHFECDCGWKDTEERMVVSGDDFTCPECGREYCCVWKGMVVLPKD